MENSQQDKLSQQIYEDIESLEKYIEEFSFFLPLSVFTINPRKVIVDLNESAKKMTGFNEIDLVGEYTNVFFKDKALIDDFLEKAIKKDVIKNQEMIIITKESKEIPISASVAKRKDREGNFIGFFLAISDITEIKKLQEGLEEKVSERTKELERTKKSLINMLEDTEDARKKVEEEKNKTSLILSNLVDPIIVVDENGCISLLNPAAKEVLGLKDDDLGQQAFANENYSMNNFQKIARKDFEVKEINEDKPEEERSEEITIQTGGKEAIYKVITAKVFDKELYLGTMKIFHDLTREKAIDRMKSEFISIAAHQLRTPLSAIKWVIKMVLDGDSGKLNDEQKELLDKGYKSNERIIELVNDLLSVSRIEEGRFGYDFNMCDFQEVVNIVEDNIKNLIKKNSQKLKITKPNKIPRVYIDKERILLVLQNLVDNAIKYTPEFGKIEIIIEKKDDDFLEVAVKDNGVGIPEEDKVKLFTKFFRATNVMRMQTEGSGLGLFIARNIIEEHKGRIYVESEEGKGTKISFT
ncbi:MAG: ATP-binding protein, partial [Patescibacteria group bacterium]|nr:ATP-binding protein [Patescibacteria group bacterium]